MEGRDDNSTQVYSGTCRILLGTNTHQWEEIRGVYGNNYITKYCEPTFRYTSETQLSKQGSTPYILTIFE
jgi:hypothetical protein